MPSSLSWGCSDGLGPRFLIEDFIGECDSKRGAIAPQRRLPHVFFFPTKRRPQRDTHHILPTTQTGRLPRGLGFRIRLAIVIGLNDLSSHDLQSSHQEWRRGGRGWGIAEREGEGAGARNLSLLCFPPPPDVPAAIPMPATDSPPRPSPCHSLPRAAPGPVHEGSEGPRAVPAAGRRAAGRRGPHRVPGPARGQDPITRDSHHLRSPKWDGEGARGESTSGSRGRATPSATPSQHPEKAEPRGDSEMVDRSIDATFGSIHSPPLRITDLR